MFHWHIVDTHSFPVELMDDPINQMTQYGAYGPDSIYTQQDIRDIVAYANKRGNFPQQKVVVQPDVADIFWTGVRVIPEFDQPAHVGNGWQFPGAETYTVCMNYEPWYKKCVEPPCGQVTLLENAALLQDLPASLLSIRETYP